jgi:hypothetical protein
VAPRAGAAIRRSPRGGTRGTAAGSSRVRRVRRRRRPGRCDPLPSAGGCAARRAARDVRGPEAAAAATAALRDRRRVRIAGTRRCRASTRAHERSGCRCAGATRARRCHCRMSGAAAESCRGTSGRRGVRVRRGPACPTRRRSRPGSGCAASGPIIGRCARVVQRRRLANDDTLSGTGLPRDLPDRVPRRVVLRLRHQAPQF